MNLLQLRTRFREVSGRHDLVNEDGSDNGADFFINEGSKFLDRMDENQKSWASAYKWIDVGHFTASFPYCRAIKEVWVATSTERWQLEKISLQNIISTYMTGLPSSRTNGTPLYYSPTLTRYIPEDAAAGALEAFSGFVDIPAGNVHEYNMIILNVPTDTILSAEIKGLFYSKALEDDADLNYWSEAHPFLLIMAAMRQLEVVNRNVTGVKDWNTSIGYEMQQIGMDLVEELIAEVDVMEG